MFRKNLKFRMPVKIFIIALLLVILVLLIPTFAPIRLQHMLIISALWAIVGMGWLVILMVGEFSFGQAGLLAIGAYSASLLTLKLGLFFWLALIIAALFTAIFALLIGIVVFRLRGLYFALITFIFAEIIRITLIKTDYLGSSQGLFGMPRPADLGPISFSTKEGWFFLVILILIIASVTFWRMKNSRIGRFYTWVGGVPDLAQSFGIRLMKYKIQAFVLSSFFTGLAGGIMAHYIRAISPDGFSLWFSMYALMVPVIGGSGYLIAGPIVGSLVLNFFDQFLALTAGPKTISYGLLLLLIVVFLPEGLLSIPKRFVRKSRGKPLWRFSR